MQKRQCLLRVWSLTALLCLASGSAFAVPSPSPQATTSKVQGQVVKVSGTITDENGEGVPGATVKIQGGAKGVMTDVDGTFTIDVPKGSKLNISFLGYTPETVEVTGPTINVQLVPQSEELEEFTFVAFGNQKKESVVGAISTIDASALRVPVGNLSSAIAGKIAGAVVMQRNAEPGAGADLSNVRWTLSTPKTSSRSLSSKTLPLLLSTVSAVLTVSSSSLQNEAPSPSPA